MANATGKSNPASKRMMNPSKKAKRARNKAKNEKLRSTGQHPKQLREESNRERAKANRALVQRLDVPLIDGQVRKQAAFIRNEIAHSPDSYASIAMTTAFGVGDTCCRQS